MDEQGDDIDSEYNRKRNLDRRRESSRFAARDRRGKEADIFTDLKEVVPLVDEATVTHVDRIALLRVASTLCRLRKVAAEALKTDLCEEKGQIWSENTLLESLDGFLAIVDLDGVILYVTESVSVYLGLTQTDLTGRFLKEFVHVSDYDEFTSCDAGSSSVGKECGRITTLRMKSVISPRGRNLNLKSALFKPVICHVRSLPGDNGRVRIVQASAQPAGQGSNAAVAARNADIPNGTFMTRHTCDMKFSYVSEGFNYILRHEARSLMGTSFYNLVHPADLPDLVASIRELLAKGHTRTSYYRLIGANKSVLWVQTEATAVNHTTKGHKGQYVICIHDLLGTQLEQESFMGGRTIAAASPFSSMPVKREIEENLDAAKNSYDEVLQWLFLAQQHNESPPRMLFRAQGNQRCGLRANGARTTYVGGAAQGGSRGCTTHCTSADFSENTATISPARLSSISASDAYVLPSSNIENGGTTTAATGIEQRNPSNMFTTVSPTCTQYARSVGYDPYLNSSATATNTTANTFNRAQNSNHYSLPRSPVDSVTEQTRVNYNKENSGGGEDMETSDDWQMFAPFVAQDDLRQLTTDLQGLLPEFGFLDWVPSDPAPLPVLQNVERKQLASRKIAAESASNTIMNCNPADLMGITPVENVSLPMQMVFGRQDLCGNSISSIQKLNSFGLSGFGLTSSTVPSSLGSSVAVTSKRGITFGSSKTTANDTSSSSSATSWRNLQQQYQQQQQQNAGSQYSHYSWSESALCSSSNDPALAFHRSASAMQQQQRV